MTSDRFREALDELGISQVGFARFLQVNPRTVAGLDRRPKPCPYDGCPAGRGNA